MKTFSITFQLPTPEGFRWLSFEDLYPNADQRWTMFVRMWRDAMRDMFLPPWRRRRPRCRCEPACRDLSMHRLRMEIEL